ncbi:MAG: hypothetical protein LBV67_02620, partial [Streptococcaceae bacterium]|nr:hypothetical protein [Streptococcaceae bacterium]
MSKKEKKNKNKSSKKSSTRQKNMIRAGALFAIGTGAMIASQGGLDQAKTILDNLTSQLDKQNSSRRVVALQNLSAKDLTDNQAGDEAQSVAQFSTSKVKSLPSIKQLSEEYGTGVNVSKVHTAYDIQDIYAINDADVYYTSSTYSQTSPMLMKMNGYRTLIQGNKNIEVTANGNYKAVSPHLYSSREDALKDSANWKNSRVVTNTRAKSLSFSSKAPAIQTNFRADDGVFIGDMKIDTGLKFDVKDSNSSAKLTDTIKADFEDAIEKNLTVQYQGQTYHAIYHDDKAKIDHGKSNVDGYFTFSDSTHGLPLQINNHFIIVSANYGETVGSLQDALTLHGVTSYEDTSGWTSNEDSVIFTGLNFVSHLADEKTTFYQIEAQEQVIHSVMYNYITVAKDTGGDLAQTVKDTVSAAASDVVGVLSDVFIGQHAAAATVSSGAITPGATLDTGNHTMTSNAFAQASNWTTTSTSNETGSTFTNGWVNMDTNGTNRGVWTTFNNAMDMTKPFTFTYGEKSSLGTLLKQYYDYGDAMGVIFSPVGTTAINTGKTGAGLGLYGLANSVFVGRDMYQNDAGSNPYGIVDPNNVAGTWHGDIFGNQYGSNMMRIQTTNAQGTFNTPGTSSGSLNPVGDAGNLPNGGDTVVINWFGSGGVGSAVTVNANGTVTGNMNVTINGKTITYPNLTVNAAMSMSMIGATGANYSAISYNLGANTTTTNLGTSNVLVNYLNATTGKQMSSAGTAWAQSSITANVGDKIGITPTGTPNAGDNYDYSAPAAPAGYSLSTISPSITVQNYDTTLQADPNIINVSYTANAQTGGVNYAYATGTPATRPSLPANQTFTGVTDGTINFTPDTIPAGYTASYKSATGTFSTLAAAVNSIQGQAGVAGTFAATTTANTITATLTANAQTAAFNFAYDASSTGPAVSNITQSGVTGQALTDPTSAINAKVPSGYFISSVTGPNGTVYPSLAAALTANPNLNGTSNNWTITLKAS